MVYMVITIVLSIALFVVLVLTSILTVMKIKNKVRMNNLSDEYGAQVRYHKEHQK